MRGNNSRASSLETIAHRTANRDSQVDSQIEKSWEEVYATLDEAGFPPEFMANRDQGTLEHREHDNEH